MSKGIPRGTVVLADDPYCSASGRRPFLIVSDESYPFYPSGYLGIPMTRKDKTNTFELTEYDIDAQYEEFEKDSNFVNPYSPQQVNEWGRHICRVRDDFVDMMVDRVSKSLGIVTKA